MKRQIYQKLKHWKQAASRKPLILQGARQVGKTYVLETFGQNEYQDFAYINFEQDKRARDIFDQDLQPERIITALNLRLQIKIQPGKTLIFFDEIQECPNALNSLKYFCEQAPEYHVVAAGSLLGVKLSKDKGFPVGKVNFLELYPMSFFEFIHALGKQELYQYLNELNEFSPLNNAVHQDLCDLLKLYLYVGGMPEAVKTYIKSQDFFAVRVIHDEIIKAYQLDFAKHAPENQIMKITAIWQALPEQLAKENKKFQITAVKPGARFREYEVALQWLIDAGLVCPAYNIKVPKLPLRAYLDGGLFKLYCLDVGILGAMSGLDAQVILEKNTLFTEFKGSLTENLAAQLLKVSGIKQLLYWTSGNIAEVDFVMQISGGVQPLEIKAGVSSKNKSLRVYADKYQPALINRASLMNLRRDNSLCNYPLYLLERFPIDSK